MEPTMPKRLYAFHIIKLLLVAVIFYAVTTLIITAAVTSPSEVEAGAATVSV
jgi:hypothetical protein